MNNLPGLRFDPTKEELLSFFLHNKLRNLRDDMKCFITAVNVFSLEPWHLPRLAGELCLQNKDQWFFFCPQQERETASSWPSQRSTAFGYWKATGSPVVIYSSNQRRLGMKKTLVFYYGRPPKGEKTLWKMNQYRLFDDQPNTAVNTVVSDDAPKTIYRTGKPKIIGSRAGTSSDCTSEVLDG